MKFDKIVQKFLEKSKKTDEYVEENVTDIQNWRPVQFPLSGSKKMAEKRIRNAAKRAVFNHGRIF